MGLLKKGHKIVNVIEGSIGEEMEIKAGDFLLSINNKIIEDVFDYHYNMNEEYLEVVIQKANGEEWQLEIEKDDQDDLGLEFEQGLMDDYRTCNNRCMFCFIDQMPPDMRETLYFKDDDARLSFLQGNYITLTNLKEKDITRILRYKLSPINISIQTMNPDLRCKMLHNRFAGDSLKKLKAFYNGEIEMNSQIVLCKGINDGAELDYSISELSKYLPYMRSLSVVPVGLTKYRKGLVPLEKFSKEEATKVLSQIHHWQEVCLKKYGTRFVYASDEWYLTAEEEIPKEEYYEGYGQIENGVGMLRSFVDEVTNYLEDLKSQECCVKPRKIALVTGVLAGETIKNLLEKIKKQYSGIEGWVYPIVNEFFGHDITVAGLLTGQDIISQLKGKELGEYLMLPDSLLRRGEQVLLDDITVKDIEMALQIPIRIVQSDGISFVDTILDIEGAD